MEPEDKEPRPLKNLLEGTLRDLRESKPVETPGPVPEVQRRRLTEAEILECMDLSGVPARFRNAKPSQVSQIHLRTSVDALKKRNGLFITGPVGCGKTHFTAALLRYSFDRMLIMDGYAAGTPFAFTSISRMLSEAKKSFNEHGVDRLLHGYMNTRYLILDDFGVEKITDWSYEYIYSIIDHRYENMMSTIITSNFTLEQVAGAIGERIASRIAGMCKAIRLEGSDRRVEEQRKL